MESSFDQEAFFSTLEQDPNRAFEMLFRAYFPYLCVTAYKFIPDDQVVEDLAQEVFYELWKRKERLSIETSLKAYLRRSVINRALNYIRLT